MSFYLSEKNKSVMPHLRMTPYHKTGASEVEGKSLITFIAFSHSLNLIIKVSQAYKAQLVGLLGHFSLGHT